MIVSAVLTIVVVVPFLLELLHLVVVAVTIVVIVANAVIVHLTLPKIVNKFMNVRK